MSIWKREWEWSCETPAICVDQQGREQSALEDYPGHRSTTKIFEQRINFTLISVVEFIEEKSATAGAERSDNVHRERQVGAASDSIICNHEWIGKNYDPSLAITKIRQDRSISVAQVNDGRIERFVNVFSLFLNTFAAFTRMRIGRRLRSGMFGLGMRGRRRRR